jgi:hypothetical protein
LVQKPRRFFLQANIQRSVANQVAMSAWASKRLKQRTLWNFRFGFRFSRTLGPKASERLDRGLQFIAGQVNRQKRKHQVETVRIAAKQNEIVIVAEGREPRFARVWHEPSPSKGVDAPGEQRIVANGLQQWM